MAKIPNLPAAGALADDNDLVLDQIGLTRRLRLDLLRTFINAPLTAQIAALNLFAQMFETDGYLADPAEALVFLGKDAAGATRELGSVAQDGQWDILLKSLRLGSGIEFEFYDALDDADLYIVSADNRLVEILGGSAPVNTRLADLTAAAGTRATLAERLDVAIDGHGLPRRPVHRADHLAETRQRLRKLKLGEGGQLHIAVVGDSQSDVLTQRWIGRFAAWLAGEYGDGGPGWIGAYGGGARAAYTVARTGSWTLVRGAPSADFSKAVSSTAGDRIRYAGPGTPVLSGCDVFFEAGAGMQAQYRWNGGAWTPLPVTGTGAQVGALAGMPAAGAWTLDIDLVAGTIGHYGVIPRSAAPGVIVSKLAASGSSAAGWAAQDGATQQAMWAAVGHHLMIESLQINDKLTLRTPAQFAADKATILTRMRAARPSADLMIMAPPDVAPSTGQANRLFTAEAAKLALTFNAAFLDLQPRFGLAFADYSFSSARPFLAADDIHYIDRGGCAVVDGVIHTLLYA